MSSSLLRDRPATTNEMLAVFDDASTLRHALAFESALAQAQAEARVMDAPVAQAITAACDGFTTDMSTFAESVALAGTLAIPLVQALRARLTDTAASALHRGATSQDLADTVLMLQMKEASALLGADHARVVKALTLSARRFAAQPAVGRTLLQDARPMGFGLRIAQWTLGVSEAAGDLERTIAANANLQLGAPQGRARICSAAAVQSSRASPSVCSSIRVRLGMRGAAALLRSRQASPSALAPSAKSRAICRCWLKIVSARHSSP